MITELTHYFILNSIFLMLFGITFIWQNLLVYWFSFVLLIISFLASDFSVLNVAHFSSILQSPFFKLSALWANQEGSMLLWILILGVNSLIYLGYKFWYNISAFKFFRIVWYINIFFIIVYVLGFSNPFLKSPYLSIIGAELNPVLQDPTLIIHPPLLYIGYLSFGSIFCLGLYFINLNNISNYTLNLIKSFNTFTWTSLTAGISLGAWWAYYELGWGGWWFWDPVENISLIPWLSSTVLIHLFLINTKLNIGFYHSLIIIFITFYFSMVGTYLIRSGALLSVHSFAQDPSIFLGIYLILLTVITLKLLLNLKAFPRFIYPIFSKISYLINANLILLFISAVILLSILIPIFANYLFSFEFSLGPNFFNLLLAPTLISILFFMAITPFMPWIPNQSLFTHKSFYKSFSNLSVFLYQPFIYSLLLVLIPILFLHNLSILSIIIIPIIILGFYSIFLLIIKYAVYTRITLAHLSVFLFLLAVFLNLNFQSYSIFIAKPGDLFNLSLDSFNSNLNLLFRNLQFYALDNYLILFFDFLLIPANGLDLIHSIPFFPEQRFYFINQVLSFKPLILSNFLLDLYVLIADGNLQTGWFIKLISNPMNPLIWISFISLVLSSFLKPAYLPLIYKSSYSKGYL